MYPIYYSGSPNFGDALNPILYRHITGKDCKWVAPETQGKIIACGSIAQSALPSDIVWGSGIISRDIELKCGVTTQIAAARGPLTSDLFYQKTGKKCEIYGDPGLLISKYIPPSKEKTQKVGILPHYTDRDIVTSDPNLKEFYIDIMSGVESVIRCVTKCDYIITSALHGIVCAEAYGIPAIWVEFSDNVAGKGFKFDDYYMGTNREPRPPVNWRKKREMVTATDWKPPEVDLDTLLAVCPFEWEETDYKRWIKVGNWNERNMAIGKIVDENSSIIEFGAGNETMRKFIPESCRYVGSDIYKRFPTTIVCDLNTPFLPDLSSYDTIIMSGVLEYIHVKNIENLIEHARGFINKFICSYNHATSRAKNGWVNDLSKNDLICMFAKYGYKLDRDYGGIYVFIQ